MSIRDKLIKAVGSENFSDKPQVLESFSKDFSVEPAGMPNYVVKANTVEQIQKVINFANENKLPVVPVSSGVHFYGAAIPSQGGIILDMTGMNKVLEVDELNRRIRIEAGATWGQVCKELDKKGLRIMMPLLPHASRSVVMDYMEREVITNTVYDYGEPLESFEVVWPTGEAFRMGSASVTGYPDSPSKGANPSGPGLDFYRFFQGAQGTMGVVTWANMKIQSQPKIDKVLFASFNDLGLVTEFLYRILRIRIGQEVVLLNNVDLATIIADDMAGDFERLRATLPPWTLVLVISGLKVLPEEKIKYEEDALKEILRNEFSEVFLSENFAGYPALGKKMITLLRQPWPKNETYWKNRYKGACQTLSFVTRPNLAPAYIDVLNEVAVAYGYPLTDIGCYIQPIEHNRACNLEFDLFYNPENPIEAKMVHDFYYKAAEVLMSQGAFFSR
ncbi:MAG: hypothetical protein A2Z02_02825, partial [Chloroflexi bacterium RBG_16_48_7]